MAHLCGALSYIVVNVKSEVVQVSGCLYSIPSLVDFKNACLRIGVTLLNDLLNIHYPVVVVIVWLKHY